MKYLLLVLIGCSNLDLGTHYSDTNETSERILTNYNMYTRICIEGSLVCYCYADYGYSTYSLSCVYFDILKELK